MVPCNRQSISSLRRLTSAIAVTLRAALPGFAPAVDIGAAGNGDWSSAATWTSGVPGTADNAYIGSTYPTGAAATATVTLSQNTSAGTVNMGNGAGTTGTVDLSGQTFNPSNLNLGQNGSSFSVQRTGGGTLMVGDGLHGTLNQYGGDLTFGPNDSTAYLETHNNATTTINGGRINEGLSIDSGCTLTALSDFGANGVGIAGTLNANFHRMGATSIGLALSDSFAFLNRGPFSTGRLTVSSEGSPGPTTFNMNVGDIASTFYLYGANTTLAAGTVVQILSLYSNGATPPTYASATTTASDNVFEDITISPGCTLTLGANLSLTFQFGNASNVSVSGTLNANGHTVNVPAIYIGQNGGPVAIQNDGLITANVWSQTGGSQVTLHQPGDALGSLLLSASSALAIADAAGQTSGLTVTGRTADSISIDSTSDLILNVNGLARGWVFRWADPIGGDHIADLQNFINAGEITFSYFNGGYYTLTSDASYTYVNVVPEPSALLLSVSAAVIFTVRRSVRTLARSKRS
jgi:hypothetical protein